jgi:hypothetical protein
MPLDSTPPAPPALKASWSRFAVLVADGRYLVDAYLSAGFQCTRATAYVNASKLRKKPAVASAIDSLLRQERERSRARAVAAAALAAHLGAGRKLGFRPLPFPGGDINS